MKKIALLLSALLVSSVSVAQMNSSKHEFFISYGTLPILSEKFADLKEPMIGTVYLSENEKEWGSVNVGYLYSISRNLAIGLSYNYSTTKADLWLPNAELASAKRKDTYHIVMPGAKYEWLTWKHFAFYSKAGVGIIFGKRKVSSENGFMKESTEKKRFFAWQASPIGIEWGNTCIAGFVEGGIGAVGCVQVGVRFKL